MATDTFFKNIVIDEKAADIIIAEMDKQIDNPENEFSIFEKLKRGEELFQQRELRLKQSSEQSRN